MQPSTSDCQIRVTKKWKGGTAYCPPNRSDSTVAVSANLGVLPFGMYAESYHITSGFVPFYSISLHKFSQKTQISVCSLKATYGKPWHSTIVLWHQAQRMHLLEPALAAKAPESIYLVTSVRLHTFSKRRFPNFWKKSNSENDVFFC